MNRKSLLILTDLARRGGSSALCPLRFSASTIQRCNDSTNYVWLAVLRPLPSALGVGPPARERFRSSTFSPMFNVMKLALVIIFANTLAHATDVPITQDELVLRTQELCDAIAPGNQAPWKKYFADDCIFSDERGRTMDKAKLMADITPMPAGYSGAIKIVNVQSRIIGDTAILSYDLNETETIFGQNLTARYHVTDTWIRRNREWSDRD
jgi:hypothetical protein